MKSKTYNDIQDKSIHLVISMREDYKRYVRSFGKKHSVSTISTKADVWLKKTQSNFDNSFVFLFNQDDLAQSDFWINKCTHKTRIKIYIYYLWLEIDTSTGGILVVDGIIHPLVSVLDWHEL
jgi:hypothetical protein